MTLLSVFNSPLAVPLQELNEPLFDQFAVRVFVKREDLIHPVISGNKWYKLKYNFSQAVAENYKTLISFGGAYSNHIHALAYAGKQAGLQTIGLIRGEAYRPLNATLQFAVEHGMRLHYLSREQYRQRSSPAFIATLLDAYGPCYVIPEGGTNALAVQGCGEIVNTITVPFDVICCACGTGGTLAGLICGLSDRQFALGFAVLKNGAFLTNDVQHLLTSINQQHRTNWAIEAGFHCGGYGKVTAELKAFMAYFQQRHGIPLEQIYTGKMFFGIYELIRRGYFAKGTRLVALHSGGRQGRSELLCNSVDSIGC